MPYLTDSELERSLAVRQRGQDRDETDDTSTSIVSTVAPIVGGMGAAAISQRRRAPGRTHIPLLI